MKCPHCGDQGQNGLDEICTNCNQAMNQCPDCNYQNPLMARNCSNCGIRLGRRRLGLSRIPSLHIPQLPVPNLAILCLILGILLLISVFIVPIFWKWEPYTEITLGVVAAFFFVIFHGNYRGFPISRIFFGWRMFLVYITIAWLLIAIAAAR
jgi:hypothetical protein